MRNHDEAQIDFDCTLCGRHFCTEDAEQEDSVDEVCASCVRASQEAEHIVGHTERGFMQCKRDNCPGCKDYRLAHFGPNEQEAEQGDVELCEQCLLESQHCVCDQYWAVKNRQELAQSGECQMNE